MAIATFRKVVYTSGGYVDAIQNQWTDEAFFFVVP
jgi:hypothetical protein